MEKDDRLLFSTENGYVRHCACRDLMVLRFLDHGMALTRNEYRDFHFRLMEAANCPLTLKHLLEGGRMTFRAANGGVAFKADKVLMEELLWLLDSARYMLDARDAAAKGFLSGNLKRP